MALIRACLLILSVAFLIGPPTACADDADTLTIDGTRYRLDGIDAPEMDQLCLDATGKLYLCGQIALRQLRHFAASREIRCEDRGADTSHGAATRRIGQCIVGGIELNRWLVRQGWAVNFEPYARGRYKDDERYAREHRMGLWSGCFVRPRDFRYTNKEGAALLGAACPPDAHAQLFPDDPEMPPGCNIKGKYAKRALITGHRGIYHLPGCGSYRRTKTPDRWFCSEADARAAGFRSSFTCALR